MARQAAARPRQTGRTDRNLCKNVRLAAISQVLAERRSISWSGYEQHGFLPGAGRSRLDCERLGTTLSWLRPRSKPQPPGTAMPSSRTIPVNGIDMFLLEAG